ncbi:MAG: hypothetical protein JSS65_02300 [Armatimonadetes bacterium]|nr:hypothetical protein [Armatimonadota bacterium]
MSVEAPVSNFILSLHADPTLATAAFLPMMAMCMFIESPVIDLLTTSTTLGARRSAYPVLRRYAQLACLWVTLVHALVVFTPLYDLLALRALNLQPDVARTAHGPLMIMTCWAGFVGWRRYLQGLMIRNGETRKIGVGTFLRMSTVVVSGLILTKSTHLPGLVIVAIGLLASVVAESLYIHWASRPTVALYLRTGHEDDDGSITLASVFKFHLPLVGTMLIVMSLTMVVTAALGKGLDSVVSLAAWQLASSSVWLFRTITFALPEVIISKFEGGKNAQFFFRFSTLVGGACSAVMAVAVLFGIETIAFKEGYQAEPNVVKAASLAFAICVALPLVSAWLSYCRAALTAMHDTSSRFWAIIVDIAVLFGMLQLGLLLRWPGVVNAGVATTTSLSVEALFLAHKWRVMRDRMQGKNDLAHAES